MAHRLLPLLMACLALGCTVNVDPALLQPRPHGSASPAATASASPAPKPSAAVAAHSGDVSGFVYGDAGTSQPLALATVSAAGLKTHTGNPEPTSAIAEDDEDQGSNAQSKDLNVLHDFNDGLGPVPTERVLRQHVPASDPGLDDHTNAHRQYAYLRAGEFLLEGLPAGNQKLTASFDASTSASKEVMVHEDQLVTDVVFNLAIPLPVASEDGKTPRVLTWRGSEPAAGITVRRSTKDVANPDGTANHTVTLAFDPDPPDVTVTLAAPPGSGGDTVKAIDLIYSYNTPAREAAGQPPLQLGPTRLPVPPLTIAPGGVADFGPAASLTIPIGMADLEKVFAGAGQDAPGFVTCNVELIDDSGFAVQDEKFQNLQIGVTIRAL